MTAKLLPALLECFHDEYVSVRTEACIACNNLKIIDERVVEKLLFLATYDPIWKIKALALQGITFPLLLSYWGFYVLYSLVYKTSD